MDKIHTTIKLFAILREGRFDITTGEFPIGTTVDDVIQQIRYTRKRGNTHFYK